MKNWQDKVLMVIGFSFTLALIPSIVSESKPALWSCALTGGGLTLMAFIFLSLRLRLTAISNGTCAVAWWILLTQKLLGG